jgi:hypothetical protein
MLVIEHLKEYVSSDVSALNLPKQVGGTFLCVGSHGFVLGGKGVLYI